MKINTVAVEVNERNNNMQYFLIKSGEAGYNLYSDMREEAECYRECSINCAREKANEIRANINPKKRT